MSAMTSRQMSRVGYRQWQAATAAPGLGFDAGMCAGTRITAKGVVVDEPIGTVDYQDPFGDGSTSTYQAAHWTSPQITSPFAFHELVASWSAETPTGTWVEISARVTAGVEADSTGEPDASDWSVLGRWAEDSSTISRTTVPGRSRDGAHVDCDVLTASDGVGFRSWQLRVSLLQATDTPDTPTVSSVGAAVARWLSADSDEGGGQPVPTPLAPSSPQVADQRPPAESTAWGKVLDVPTYSQTLHLGEYPDLNGGGEAWCSPTSTAMVLAYWQQGPSPDDYAWVDPTYSDPWVDHAAAGTFDSAYDGCGNWSFNVAYAAGFGLDAYVTRLRSLEEAERFIAAGVPLVASVSFAEGELTGAGYSTQGHLLVVAGFTESGDVVVNDPASHLVPSNDQVRATYDRAEFERAWLPTSGGTVYVIHPPGHAAVT